MIKIFVLLQHPPQRKACQNLRIKALVYINVISSGSFSYGLKSLLIITNSTKIFGKVFVYFYDENHNILNLSPNSRSLI